MLVVLLAEDVYAWSLLSAFNDREVLDDHQTVQVMSIMRDNWVPIPGGHGEKKINAATALGGIPLMVQTVGRTIDDQITLSRSKS